MNIVKWDKYHCFGMFLTAIIYFFIGSIQIVLIPAIVSFVYLWITNWSTLKKPVPGGSYANRITILRFVGLLTVGFLWSYLTNLQISIILGILILLDGLDGFLARKFHQESTFGAYFDMETDALYVCLAAVILFQKGIADKWILFPGFMRYVYMVLVSLLALNEQNDRRTKLGPVIATIMFISLCVSFVLPKHIATLILVAASVLLVISFGYSFFMLLNYSNKTS